MKIKKSQLNEIINNYLLNEVFGLQRFIPSGNARVDAFKNELREALTSYYKQSNDAVTELFGTVDRNVGRILKTIWAKHVDREFINNVVKIHYMRLDKLPDFFKNMNPKNEISAVGYLPGETPLKEIKLIRSNKQVAVRLKGYTTLASNENMQTGRISLEDAEKYAASGIPKFADSNDATKNFGQHFGSLYSQLYTLQSQIERVSRFIILDSETHMSTSQRVGSNKPLKNIARAFLGSTNLTDWNEYVLDNWEVDAIIDVSNFKENDINEYSHLEVFAENRGIPILSLDEATIWMKI